MNPIISLITGGKQAGISSAREIMTQALNAAMRNESPEAFLQGLAQKDPRFANLDLKNLEQTANKLCQDKGVDPEALKTQISNFINNSAT